jgi:hypothetical protein
MHVTNRIKSQLVGMKTVISANYACFKLTIFKYSLVFLHVSGFESLGAPITNTNSANLGGHYHQQFQWLNCEGPIAARYFNHPCHI